MQRPDRIFFSTLQYTTDWQAPKSPDHYVGEYLPGVIQDPAYKALNARMLAFLHGKGVMEEIPFLARTPQGTYGVKGSMIQIWLQMKDAPLRLTRMDGWYPDGANTDATLDDRCMRIIEQRFGRTDEEKLEEAARHNAAREREIKAGTEEKLKTGVEEVLQHATAHPQHPDLRAARHESGEDPTVSVAADLSDDAPTADEPKHHNAPGKKKGGRH